MAFKYALLVISAQLCATLTDAACPCPREYRPLCGSDGITYNNPCLLRCATTASGNKIKMVKNIPCDEPIPEIDSCTCSYEYSPVCGSDGETYQNECSLKCLTRTVNQSLKVKHSGPCETQKESTCFCTLLYKPVCGSDGKTYSNNCRMSCAGKTNLQLRFAHDGPCLNSLELKSKLKSS